jgi:outer membrane receptor protein involved in Fe transport
LRPIKNDSKHHLQRSTSLAAIVLPYQSTKIIIMKKFISIVFLFFSIAIKAQLVSYTPLNSDFDTTITIQFNLNLSQGEKASGLLGKKDGLYLWAVAGISESNAFEFTPKAQYNFNAPVEGGKLTSLGGNRWEISINPKTYFGVPAGKKIVVLGLIVKNEAGSAQTENIILQQGSSKALSEVVITSKKPFIEQQIDKTVVNVQADINAIGSTAFEILQKAPGISITGDDNINMSGKAGVNVLIDGRPTQMSSKELANFLRGMPGSTIDKIELITNPSSRFDAQGNAGIINIRLKKNKLQGTNGNLTAGYTQQQHYRSNGSFNINHRQGKLNAFINADINNNLQHTTGVISRLVTVNNSIKTFNNTTVDKDRNISNSIRAGIDFYQNKKSTFGILFNSNGNWNPFNTPGNTNISSNGFIDSSLQTTNDNLYKNRRYNTNFNYRYEDTLGNELNIDADYTNFNNTNTTKLGTDFIDKFNRNYNFTANELDVATIINIYSLKADYSRQLKKLHAKIETGFKLSNVNTNNNLFATVLNGGAMKADTGRSNLFEYKENVYAAYINFGQQIKKFEYQVGLRAEQSVVKGASTNLQKNTINNPDTSYLNIFPTAFVSYKLDDKNTLGLSYSKRINRPDYQALNPFETIYDIYTSEKGNPYLKPQYTNNVELKYTYRYAVNVAFGYNFTKDYSQTISRQTGQLTTATIDNIGTLSNTYLNISSPLPINKWWDGYVSITGFTNHYKGKLPDGMIDEKAIGMNYYVQNNFKLGKGWGIQLSSWYNSPTTEAIFKTKWLGSVDVGVKKTLLKEKASIRLGMLDIFNTQRYEQSVQFANQNFTYRRKWESRGLRLQLSWRFGKTDYKARERDTNQDANRIKVKG